MRNPFKPTFGVTPPLLAGRDTEIAALDRALLNGPGYPGRAMLVTGARGTGKTVLLNAFESLAGGLGWAVASTTIRRGVCQQLSEALLPRLLAKHGAKRWRSQVTGGSVSILGVGGSVTRQVDAEPAARADVRSLLEDLAEAMAAKGAGVLLSLDEVQASPIDEMREIFHAVQHCFRQGLEVAVVAAGLPAGVNDILNDDVLTFLRRADRHALGFLPEHAVVPAIRQPILDQGRAIAAAALDQAVAAVQGYPFLVQLVGFHLWEADPTAPVIDSAQAGLAVSQAQVAAARLVFKPLLADLSGRDIAFLEAMAQDPAEPSAIADIADSLGGANVSAYRARLIAAEIIEPAGRGRVRFALPGLRTYLRSQTKLAG